MRKFTKIIIIIFVAVLLIGAVIFGGIMSTVNWNFSSLSKKYVTNTCEVSDFFNEVLIGAETSDVAFLPSESEICTVECYEDEKSPCSVAVNGGVLSISGPEGSSVNFFGFLNKTPRITVYLPMSEYSALKVKTTTGNVSVPDSFSFSAIDLSCTTGNISCSADSSGDIKIRATTGRVTLEDASFRSADISVTTGEVSLSHINAQEQISARVTTGKMTLSSVRTAAFSSSGSTGRLILKDVIVLGKMSLERSTGDVLLEGVDASEIYIKTDTGNVTGNLFSEKVFVIDADTGSVNVPKSQSGGRCEINTDTGDVKITVD